MALTKATYSMIEGAVVNILDYGADPTGVADSTAAIQAAFDYAGSLFIPDIIYPNENNYGIKGGTTVFLPAGEYAVSGRLNVPQNVNIVGAGRNSTLISSSYDGTILANYVVPTQSGEYSQPGNVWRDFCVNGDVTKTNQVGIELLRWDLSLMSNVLIQNCGSNGIIIYQCLMSVFELVDCENNGGFGLGLRDGVSTSIDPTLNNLPTNACTFNNCHALGNGGPGLLLAQYGNGSFGGGVNGCVFNNCIFEYNSKSSSPGAGYNVVVTSDNITPNEFNECWVEDNAVNAHFLINPTIASSSTRFTNLHHFASGASSYPNRCIIVSNGAVFIQNALGNQSSYRVIGGSNSPYTVNTNNPAHIWACNLLGNNVTDNNYVEDTNNVSTGLFNFVNMNNYGAVYGPSSLKGQAGVYLDQWRTETQTYSFAAMEGGTGLVLGSGLTLPATQVRSGAGSPEGAITAPVGSMWLRTDGGAGTTLYVKQSGTGNTGWAGK